MFSESLSAIIRENEPLAQYSWLKLGGSARYFAEPQDLHQLAQVCQEAHQANMPVRVLGGGSNLLIRPGQLEAVVLRLAGQFTQIHIEGNTLTAGSAASLGDVLTEATKAGLAGLEHLAGIPGSVGGAVVGNSGITNDDIGSHVTRVRALKRDGESVDLGREAMKFGYRQSNLGDLIVTEIEFTLEPMDRDEVTRRLQTSWIVRKAAQPATGARVAQAFIEPSESGIQELLDAAGMRGASEGEAAMVTQHPGFVIVNDNADAEQVLALISKITRAVEVQTGIQLQQQLKIW